MGFCCYSSNFFKAINIRLNNDVIYDKTIASYLQCILTLESIKFLSFKGWKSKKYFILNIDNYYYYYDTMYKFKKDIYIYIYKNCSY